DGEAIGEPSERNTGNHRAWGAKEGAARVDAPATGRSCGLGLGDIVAVDLHDVVQGGAVLREDPSNLLQDVGRLSGQVARVADGPGRTPRHCPADEDHVAAADTL